MPPEPLHANLELVPVSPIYHYIWQNVYYTFENSVQYILKKIFFYFARGKSLLESWITTFLHDWQLPLILVRFISNFLCMCCNSVDSGHVILK